MSFSEFFVPSQGFKGLLLLPPIGALAHLVNP
jgi:hypothetical protein